MYGKLINGTLKVSKNYLIYNGRKIWNAPESLWLEAGWKHIIYGEWPEGYEEVITEYYGANQVSNQTGQLLPVISIIGDITEVTPSPYDRYLVGSDGVGYYIYEYVIDSEGSHRWIIKKFDYRYGVRVIENGLKNYVYVNGVLRTYDDVDCGEF